MPARSLVYLAHNLYNPLPHDSENELKCHACNRRSSKSGSRCLSPILQTSIPGDAACFGSEMKLLPQQEVLRPLRTMIMLSASPSGTRDHIGELGQNVSLPGGDKRALIVPSVLVCSHVSPVLSSVV